MGKEHDYAADPLRDGLVKSEMCRARGLAADGAASVRVWCCRFPLRVAGISCSTARSRFWQP